MKKLNTVISSRINRSIVLTEIHRNPNISRVQLADRTGLDRSAITQILNYLIEEGLVEEVEKGKPGSKGGRCPIFLQVRHTVHTVIAIEVGLDHASAIIADLQGRELTRTHRSVNRGEPLLQLLTTMLDELSAKSPEDFRKATVIAIGAPGVIDRETGVVRANMFHNWREVMVEEALQELYRKEVVVENDANVGAMGELSRISAKEGIDSLVYLFIRDSVGDAPLGVGGALVLERKVWHGVHHFAGESSASINDSFKHAVQRLSPKERKPGAKNLQSLIDAAEAGSTDAKAALQEMADRLGQLLCDLAQFIDPDAVMVSLSPHETTLGFWQLIKASYETHLSPNDRQVRFLPPQVRDRAPIEGLVALALDRIFVADGNETSILFAGAPN
ncbi:ROK family protein [bacterium]|nr:ROK family protein [bacterium]